MLQATPKQFTAFLGNHRLASGPLAEVALAVMKAFDKVAAEPRSSSSTTPMDGRSISTFVAPNETSWHAYRSRLRIGCPADDEAAPEPRGRGRPKLGVVAREVTLLPRHWEWLGAQPGGASVALRKLVEEARRASGDRDRSRAAREAAYHFMSTMAGDLAGLRGSLAGVVRRRSTALRRTHRRLARRYPRPHRQARLQRSRRRRRGRERALTRFSETLNFDIQRLRASISRADPRGNPCRTPRLCGRHSCFLAPMMLSNILQSLFGTINNVYLGQMIGVEALAAVSVFFPVMFFFISFVMGLSSGATVLIGQAWARANASR